MKTRYKPSTPWSASKGGTPQGSTRGMMLIECLVYCALLNIIFALAYGVFFRLWDNSRALQRNAVGISRALDAGERWRADVRMAHAISLTDNCLKISQSNHDIEYIFKDDAVWRMSGTESLRIMPEVKLSTMTADPRQQVKAWRWELELQSRNKFAKVHPLFTFIAVPAAIQAQ